MADSVIVWEFQSNIPGMYAPYADKVSNYIEEHYAKDPQSKVELAQVEPILKDYVIEMAAMVQTHGKRSTQRKVRRQLYGSNTTIGNGIVWEWLTDIGWIVYDNDTNNAIEDAFTKNQDELDLSQLAFNLPNIVLIQKGYQKNKSSNFVRPVQRKAVNYKSTSDAQNMPEQPARKRANQALPKLYQHSASNQPSSSLGIAAAPKYTPYTNSAVTSKTKPNVLPRPVTSNTQATGLPHKLPVAVAGSSSLTPLQPPNAIDKPSTTSEVLKFCTLLKEAPDDEECAICLIPLKDDSDDEMDDNKLIQVDPIVQLKKCKHSYHQSCMEAYVKQGQQNGCIQCPVCKAIHGIKTGNQPPGKMDVSINPRQSVAGYHGCGMITITYNISSGMQGPNDPNPRTRYNAHGFPRTAYLPANEKGKKVLKLLKLAWERKLIFAIATSTTTGHENAVVWNEIHHKTSPRDNGSGHGYPDPTYLDNVLEELKQHGVVDEESPDKNASGSVV